MELPVELRVALDRALEHTPARSLQAIAERQSLTYRHQTPDAYGPAVVETDEDALAYAAWRMPATYGAVARALDAVASRLPDFVPASHLDLGCGPGTAVWAAWARLGAAPHVVAIEQSEVFRRLAGDLFAAAVEAEPSTSAPDWRAGDLAAATSIDALAGPFDLVTATYVTGELAPSAAALLFERAWAACSGVLLVVEPGTSAGYARLMSARDILVSSGARVVAPCPHADPCPLEPGDWCHFAERVPRSRLHRQVKSAQLGYEDEKYAYLAVSRSPVPTPPAPRILRPPRVTKASVELALCTPGGLEHATIARRDKAGHKAARKARAGETWPGDGG